MLPMHIWRPTPNATAVRLPARTAVVRLETRRFGQKSTPGSTSWQWDPPKSWPGLPGTHAAATPPWLVIDDDGYAHINFSDPEAQKHLDLIKKIKTKRTRRVVVENKKPEEWEDEWVEVELYDAQAALALIGKHHKLFGDQVDVTSGGEKVAAITVIEVEKL